MSAGRAAGTPASTPGRVRWARAVDAALEAAPTALALLAEAAWVSIVASLLQAFALHDSPLGYGWFLAAAVAGLVATRLLEHRAAERWPGVVAALAVGAGAAGWLVSADVRAILAERGTAGLVDAIGANIGGWLGALAFVRGVAHARLPADSRRIGNLLGLAVPGLAAVAITGGMTSEPHRTSFLVDAQSLVVVFLVAGILALALSRLGLVGTGSALDWRRNPAWIALLVALLGGTALLALVVAAFGGQAIVMALGALATPLLIVGFFAGFGRRSAVILAIAVFAAATISLLFQLLRANRSTIPPATGADTGIVLPPDPVPAAPVTFGVLGLILAVAVIAVLVLARLWLRRLDTGVDDVPETHEIDRGDAERDVGRQRRRRFGRRPVPADAVAAYRALLQDLEAHPALRRDPAESPAAHAARLRAAGHGDLALDLLAADYGLVRFGGQALSAAEDRRAIARGRRLRHTLPGR